MLRVVDELRERIVNGEVHSVGVMVESVGRPDPAIVLCGRYETEPYRAYTALQRSCLRVGRKIDQDEREREQCAFSETGQ